MTGFRTTPQQARMIQHHRLTLARRITAERGDVTLIAAEIAKLVTAFPSQDQGAAIAGALNAEAYVEALGHLPPWAVKQAREDVISGRTRFGRPWGPGPVEFADLVRAVVKPFQDDLDALVAIEHAVVEREPSHEERKQIAAGLSALRRDLAARAEPAGRAKPTPRQDEAALRARLAANGLDPSAFDAIPDAPQTFKRATGGTDATADR